MCVDQAVQTCMHEPAAVAPLSAAKPQRVRAASFSHTRHTNLPTHPLAQFIEVAYGYEQQAGDRDNNVRSCVMLLASLISRDQRRTGIIDTVQMQADTLIRCAGNPDI